MITETYQVTLHLTVDSYKLLDSGFRTLAWITKAENINRGLDNSRYEMM